MKGEMIMNMNRFKLMTMTMNRFRLLLCTSLVVAVTALSSGIGCAQQEPAAATPAVAPVPAAAQRKAAAAVKARADRDAAVKKRRAAKEYIQKVVEGQDGAAATAPSGGAK
jgi:hypothetical protein